MTYLTDTETAVHYGDALDHCRSYVIALSLMAAEAILSTYLGERVLPTALHGVLVSEVKSRLIQGQMPVLDPALREVIEGGCSRIGSPRSGNG